MVELRRALTLRDVSARWPVGVRCHRSPLCSNRSTCMSQNYDIVAMGAGHNGLVAAAYLAKAGKKVLVLERKPWPGGGVVTREINTPGYWHDEHSSVHIMIQGNPMIR